MTDHSHKELFS